MKVLVTGDWHADWSTSGVDRYDEIDTASERVVSTAIDQDVDLFVFLGDLADPDNQRSHRAVAMAIRLMALLNEAGVDGIWIAGNHDVIEDGTGVTCLRAMQDASVLCGESLQRVYERPNVAMTYDVGGRGLITENANAGLLGKQVIALPYVARSHAYDPVHFVETVDAPDVRLVVAHLTVAGAGMGTEVTDMPRGRDVMLPVDAIRKRWPNAVIVNGHHHTAQFTNGVHIPGNLARLTHGEEKNDPGFLILEVP